MTVFVDTAFFIKKTRGSYPRNAYLHPFEIKIRQFTLCQIREQFVPTTKTPEKPHKTPLIHVHTYTQTLEITYQGMSLYMLSSCKQLPTDVTTERSHACVNEQVSL